MIYDLVGVTLYFLSFLLPQKRTFLKISHIMENRENGGIKSFIRILTDKFCYKFGNCFLKLQRYRENYPKFRENSLFRVLGATLG